jgi:hypothetical protein
MANDVNVSFELLLRSEGDQISSSRNASLVIFGVRITLNVVQIFTAL